ncbi:hypothetical protein [Acinetobacter sp. Ac_5812]|uniref:gp53-like domain-containing protein n=1 Tax=Acinetobacter sp. Ac_5812 TaxID=1848937 RepID=UPI00149087D2|nr:hypothetical protein [Acinetobacter sp. Ac_5812]NNP68972.1 hypothetical protein [Acinetobacter sp. Ac_5812]
MSLTQPVLNAVAFAVNSAHINQIPISTTDRGAASFQMGFPYETMVDKLAGGVPPNGEDFNGIFNYLSKHQVWLNAGGTYKFNGPLADALGGYQKGAILASNDGLRLYVCTVDGNTTDLNSDMTGWKLIGTSELQTLLDTLQTNIDQERGWRETADADLLQRIGWESDARITNDNALQANIDQERGWRETADADLLQRIGWESDARITADNNERDARIYSDNLLNDKIDLKLDKAGGTITGSLTVNSQITTPSLSLSTFSTSNPGFTTLPNGFIMQFGFVSYSDMTPMDSGNAFERYAHVNFPTNFPNACLSTQATICIGPTQLVSYDTWAQVKEISRFGMDVLNQSNAGALTPPQGIYWQAIGY